MSRFFLAFLIVFGLATTAVAQPISSGTATSIAPGTNGSSLNVTATGGTTARTLAASAADTINAADYGFAVAASGSTNRTALVNAIAQACTAATRTVILPAGSFVVDVSGGEILDQCSGSGNMVSIMGSANGGTLIGVTNTGNNNFLHLSPPGGQSNIGHGVLSNFRLFNNTANTTAGAGIALEHTNTVMMQNIEIDGMFTDLDCISCVATQANNLNLAGNNSSSGASLLTLRRASNASTNNNPSENFFSNSDIRASSSGGYQNSIVISDSDGAWFVGDHVGFSSGANLLVKPQFVASGGGTSNDQIDGLHFVGTDFDTSSAGQCIDFEHLATFSGVVNGMWFAGGSCYHAALDGVLLNDSSLSGVVFSGFVVTDSQDHGLNIQAGTKISWTGGQFIENNLANGGFFQANIGGTSSHVTLSGANFVKGSASAIPHNITVADTADYVNVGQNDYTGSSGTDVSYTTSGTHNSAPGSSTTDATLGSWLNWTISASGAGYFLQNENGWNMVQFFTNAINANSDDIVIGGSASGGAPFISAGGADGANTTLNVRPGSTGQLTLGASTNKALILASHVGSTGTAPTLPSCGTGPSISAQSTDRSFEVTTGTGTPTACQISFNQSYTTAPKCVVSAQTSGGSPLSAAVTTKSTSGITVTISTGSTGAIIDGVCEQ